MCQNFGLKLPEIKREMECRLAQYNALMAHGDVEGADLLASAGRLPWWKTFWAFATGKRAKFDGHTYVCKWGMVWRVIWRVK